MISRKTTLFLLLITSFLYSQNPEKKPSPFESTRLFCHKISEKAIYSGLSVALGAASLFGKLGWCLSLTSPFAKNFGEESLLLGDICGVAAHQMFLHVIKGSVFSSYEKGVPLSHTSWHLNQQLLSQVPAASDEEKKLLQFLKRRWLAKSTGFFSSVVHWICPSFGVCLQVHPDTTSHYARNPWNKFSKTYLNRVNAWKKSLPHPETFPLILTRPFDVQGYLPSYVEIDRASFELPKLKACRKVLVDVTGAMEQGIKWNTYQAHVLKVCQETGLKQRQLICIHRLHQEGMGGLRILPFTSTSSHRARRHHRYLLKWISTCGLAANLIELDRGPLQKVETTHRLPLKKTSKLEFKTLEFPTSAHPQKNLMLQGTWKLLQGLCDSVSDQKWQQMMQNPTQTSLIALSLLRIQNELHFLKQNENIPFFETMSHIEEIHANLSSLIEVLSPFSQTDFSTIYRKSLPRSLQKLAKCTVHASGMTSLAGIFKAVNQSLKRKPHVIFGENAYFECIQLAEKMSQATCRLDAKNEDWENVDLILGQFNPALRRIELKATEYRVEDVSEAVRLALRPTKRLTLALDCTLDYIRSPRLNKLLKEFEIDILEGRLSVIGYRSGVKFDLFGMDNYAGAPLFMIHNQDRAWKPFDELLKDAVLQTDILSLNWFCLAYQSAMSELDQYRAQIFRNTKILLDQIPSTLFCKEGKYRIVPMEKNADAAFLDIKISGSLHQVRGSALVGGSLYTTCMKKGHPIFYRPSLGFYHPNFTMIFGHDHTTIRLTLGLDPAQVQILVDCLKRFDRLNGLTKLLAK